MTTLAQINRMIRAAIRAARQEGAHAVEVRIGDDVTHINELTEYLVSDDYKAWIKPKPTALYRHFDDQGCLLYVGVSLNALQRLCDYRSSRCFNRIARVEIDRFPARGAALTAELVAIHNERPEYNVVGRMAT
jgi:hypothetical protein